MEIIIPESVRQTTPIVTCAIEGILDEEDLRALLLGQTLPSMPNVQQPDPSVPQEEEDPTDLKKIREKHHSLARMIADGLTQRMAARISGFSESYVSVLLNSPAMQELVEMYRLQNGAAARVISEKLRATALKAVEALDEQIDAGTLKDPHALASIAKLGLDRSGHGPSSTSRVIDERHIVDYAELQKQMNDARRGSREYIVPVSDVRKALEPPHAVEEAEFLETGGTSDASQGPAPSRAGDGDRGDEHAGPAEKAA